MPSDAISYSGIFILYDISSYYMKRKYADLHLKKVNLSLDNTINSTNNSPVQIVSCLGYSQNMLSMYIVFGKA